MLSPQTNNARSPVSNGMVTPPVTFDPEITFISEPKCDMLKDDDPVRGSVAFELHYTHSTRGGVRQRLCRIEAGPQLDTLGPQGGRHEPGCS